VQLYRGANETEMQVPSSAGFRGLCEPPSIRSRALNRRRATTLRSC